MSLTQDAAHTEDGYTRVANKLLEAILAAGFSAGQIRILLALMRMTYGWTRKDVAVSNAALAERVGLMNSGSFRREFQELIAEGVIVLGARKHPEPNTVRIEKCYGKWGQFASLEADHRELWDKDFDGQARLSQYARKKAYPKIGMPEKGQDVCPKKGIPSPVNSPKDNALAGGKEIKKSLRGVSKKKDGWVTDFGNDWTEMMGGSAPFGKIGAAIKPLLDNPRLALTPEIVRPVWKSFLSSKERKYGAHYFAEHYGDFAGTSRDALRQKRSEQRGIIDG